HVTPRAQGGQSRWENCVLACLACNKRKADRAVGLAGWCDGISASAGTSLAVGINN
ncbi:MAG: HNH endonuclease signature motif containing protein, partial [Candidatus Aminicenantes bacterium]